MERIHPAYALAYKDKIVTSTEPTPCQFCGRTTEVNIGGHCMQCGGYRK